MHDFNAQWHLFSKSYVNTYKCNYILIYIKVKLKDYKSNKKLKIMHLQNYNHFNIFIDPQILNQISGIQKPNKSWNKVCLLFVFAVLLKTNRTCGKKSRGTISARKDDLYQIKHCV